METEETIEYCDECGDAIQSDEVVDDETGDEIAIYWCSCPPDRFL